MGRRLTVIIGATILPCVSLHSIFWKQLSNRVELDTRSSA